MHCTMTCCAGSSGEDLLCGWWRWAHPPIQSKLWLNGQHDDDAWMVGGTLRVIHASSSKVVDSVMLLAAAMTMLTLTVVCSFFIVWQVTPAGEVCLAWHGDSCAAADGHLHAMMPEMAECRGAAVWYKP